MSDLIMGVVSEAPSSNPSGLGLGGHIPRQVPTTSKIKAVIKAMSFLLIFFDFNQALSWCQALLRS